MENSPLKRLRWALPFGLGAVTLLMAWGYISGLVGPAEFAFAGEEKAYSGSKKCKKCHLKVYKAFIKENKMAKTLDDFKPEEYTKMEDVTDSGKYCVECHVTAFGKPGGFQKFKDVAEVNKMLGDKKSKKKFFESVGHVGCETCHGPGVAHNAVSKEDMKKLFQEGKDTLILRRVPNSCVDCHNPHVSHVRGKEVKGTWTKDRGPSTASFEGATYIGHEACKPCHEKQYETWSKTKHASTFSVVNKDEYDKVDDALELKLEKPPKAKKCIECHVTGYGKPGGFKSVGDAHSMKLIHTSCEACHGPGSLHKAMADEYEAQKKELKGVKDQKINRVPQNVCRECHHTHVSHKKKYPGRR
ncbi:MAG: cytochrome c family protein [Planctomycetota bacterium]